MLAGEKAPYWLVSAFHSQPSPMLPPSPLLPKFQLSMSVMVAVRASWPKFNVPTEELGVTTVAAAGEVSEVLLFRRNPN